MMRGTGPFELWGAGIQLWLLSAEAGMVVSYRLMGLAGLWNTDRHEPLRMWAEKPGAVLRAAHAAGVAAALGAAPIAVVAAATGPLRLRTRANARRLARRGPGRPRK